MMQIEYLIVKISHVFSTNFHWVKYFLFDHKTKKKTLFKKYLNLAEKQLHLNFYILFKNFF